MTATLPKGSLPVSHANGKPSAAYVALDLSGLPSERAARVRRKAEEAYWRERAAAAIPEAYARKLQRYRQHRAWREAAAEVNRALGLPRHAGGFVVSARFVRSVLEEGR